MYWCLQRDKGNTAFLILLYTECPMNDESKDNRAKYKKKQHTMVIGIAVPVLHTGFPPRVKVQRSLNGEW